MLTSLCVLITCTVVITRLVSGGNRSLLGTQPAPSIYDTCGGYAIARCASCKCFVTPTHPTQAMSSRGGNRRGVLSTDVAISTQANCHREEGTDVAISPLIFTIQGSQATSRQEPNQPTQVTVLQLKTGILPVGIICMRQHLFALIIALSLCYPLALSLPQNQQISRQSRRSQCHPKTFQIQRCSLNRLTFLSSNFLPRLKSHRL